MITLIIIIVIALLVWVTTFYDDDWSFEGFAAGFAGAALVGIVGALVMFGLSGVTHRTIEAKQYTLVEVTTDAYLLTGISEDNTNTVIYAYQNNGRTLVRQRDADTVLVFKDTDTPYLVMGHEKPNHLWSLIDFHSTTEVHIPLDSTREVGP